jgi:bleomycin hydrolase
MTRRRKQASLFALLGVAAVGTLIASRRNVRPEPPPRDLFANYRFESLIDLPATSVKEQGASGTCWSFAGTSLLESELIRKLGATQDLSVMYAVRNAYQEKARNYIFRQGTARFTEGGLIHDVMISAAKYGLLPQSRYSGMAEGQPHHDHRELMHELEALIQSYANPANNLAADWKQELNALLDIHLGTLPTDGGRSPVSFLAESTLDMNDYVTITSFSHAPFHVAFVLEIPANFASERFFNLPLEEFMRNIDAALERGYTVGLDVDCSERYFGNGVAVLPNGDASEDDVARGEFHERIADQAGRQAAFEAFRTTDDHLMHIVGTAHDQHGRLYYRTKNCWGVEWGRDGFAYLSAAYLRMKAISVTLHRDGLDAGTCAALGL